VYDSALHNFCATCTDIEYKVPIDKLLELPNGKNALDFYNEGDEEDKDEEDDKPASRPSMSSSVGKRLRTKTNSFGFVSSSIIPLNSDSEDDQSFVKKRRLEKGRISLVTNNGTRTSSRVSSRISSRPPSRSILDDESSDSEPSPPTKRGSQPSRGSLLGPRSSGRLTRSGTAKPILKLVNRSAKPNYNDEDEDELAGGLEGETEDSDIVYVLPNQGKKSTKDRRGRSQSKGKKGRGRPALIRDESDSPSPERPSRRSGRERKVKSMKERDMDEEIYVDDVAVSHGPKVISIREIFQPVEKRAPFRLFHNSECDVCGGIGTNSNKGTSPLIHCQGCSTSIHKVCLGYRSGREHMVTKVGHENFVMQCRRCIGVAAKKDPSAPQLDICQVCRAPGAACAMFSPRKTAKQEEKLREENNGDDPITAISENLINNSENVLFRCTSCQRGYHFEHLPALSKKSKNPSDIDELRDERLHEYSSKWQCKECSDVPAKVQGLVAWRPVDRDSYVHGQTVDEFREDEKEYLVKWENRSYFQCTWMPGGWVWGVTAVIMRKAFFRRDEGANLLPKWTNEEAIPEEYLRMEIIFDVNYDSDFSPESESSDKAAIDMIDEVLVKFQGLSYDEAVWEDPPKPEDEERWSDFVAAYNEYVAGRYFKQPPAATMKERADTFRSLNFEKKVELKKQPTALTGGKMMPYQMEGLNWLLYNFHQKKNVILADEMGLGKTIQIIAMIASLVKDNPKVCFSFTMKMSSDEI
jgi:chromodomain-helicase-DNA-binding protein 4